MGENKNELVKPDRVMEVQAIVLGRKYRKDKHILTNDGKTLESAIRGTVCVRCHKSENEIMECKDGEKCDWNKSKWAKDK